MIRIGQCSQCAREFFPPPLLCGACGGAEFEKIEIEYGIIEQLTQVEYPQAALLASIRIAPDLVVIAAIQQTARCAAGSRMALSAAPGVEGTAYVPAAGVEDQIEEIRT